MVVDERERTSQSTNRNDTLREMDTAERRESGDLDRAISMIEHGLGYGRARVSLMRRRG